MTQNLSPQGSLRLLSGGNVINIGLRLYRSRLKLYLGIALKAFLWTLLPFLTGIAFLFFNSNRFNSPNLSLIFLLSFGWLILWMFCWAKALANQALVSRLAFNELLNYTEDFSTAKHHVNSQKWKFLIAQVLVNILLFLTYITLSILQSIINFAIAGVLVPNYRYIPGVYLIVTLLLFVVGLASLFAYIWICSRLLIADTPLAIENDVRTLETIGRSWNLTKDSELRIQLITMGLSLITVPIFSYVFIFVYLLILIGFSRNFITISANNISLFFLLVGALIIILTVLSATLVMPLWQATKAVIYCDLRNRREGLGLQLSDRTQTGSTNVMQFLNRVTLQTPESVELEFTLAGIGNRALALLIDYIVWLATLFAFMIVWSFFSYQLLDVLSNLVGSSRNVQLWLSAIAFLVTFFIYVGYFVFFEVLWQGQTPGKRYTKIRVIRDDGRRIGIQQATLRALLRPIDDTLFIGAFLIMLRKREKRLGDMVAGTLVVQEEYLVANTTFPISEKAQQLAKQLPEMANLSLLLPDDFASIREYLQRRVGMAPKARAELSLQMARQIRTLIDLRELPEGLSPDVFLEAVYVAYQEQFY